MSAGQFFVGSELVPGILQSVEIPSRDLVWQVTQGAAGGVGAATIWRGVKVAEGGTIVTTLITDEQGLVVSELEDAVGIWIPFLSLVHPNPKAKPPTWDCTHPLLTSVWPFMGPMAIAANKLVSFRNNDGLSWVGSLVLQEYFKFKRVTPAAPDPAKINNDQKGPADKAEEMILALAEKAGL